MKTTGAPMAQPCALSATWAPPMVNTPGSVQPGKGITRSMAPVARMRESKPIRSIPAGPSAWATLPSTFQIRVPGR